jgi:outer membrane lipopolysaccharide assembly protein LptE/RlpB
MRSSLLGSLCLVQLFLFFPGCGYHRAERVDIPAWIKTIYVAPWTNRSNEFLVGSWITDELRQEFLRGSALGIASREEADVILEGEVVSVSTSGLSYVRYDQAIERRIVAQCSVRMKDRKTGKVLWQTSDIVRENEFLVGREVMETEANKNYALQTLSRDVAEMIYHRIAGVF